MRVPSPILSVLKHHSGIMDPGDEVINVPPVALATLEVPVGLTEAVGTISSDFRAESFLLGATIELDDIGASEAILCGMRPGLWRFNIAIAYKIAAEPAIGSQGFSIGLRVPAAAIAIPFLPFSIRAATGPQTASVDRIVALEREARFTLNAPAVGAGSFFGVTFSLYAARLL